MRTRKKQDKNANQIFKNHTSILILANFEEVFLWLTLTIITPDHKSQFARRRPIHVIGRKGGTITPMQWRFPELVCGWHEHFFWTVLKLSGKERVSGALPSVTLAYRVQCDNNVVTPWMCGSFCPIPLKGQMKGFVPTVPVMSSIGLHKKCK